MRLFERLQSLRKIISALTSAILPVANAFVVLAVVTGIYAVVGVSMFRHQVRERRQREERAGREGKGRARRGGLLNLNQSLRVATGPGQ